MMLNSKNFNLNDANVILYPQLFNLAASDRLFINLYEEIEWKQEPVKIFGKLIMQPRFTAYYGEKSYTYSGVTMIPKLWLNSLLEIKQKIEPLVNVEFNAVLLNLYRDGNDYIGWHSDDEKDLAPGSVIGSLSLGEKRRFMLRRRDDHKDILKLDLCHGDFLVMSGKTQKFWQHQVPKTKLQINPRINLTFRVIN